MHADEVETFWEEHYGQSAQRWSGRVNALLADVVESLPAGTALDVGCGEGADAIWLARRGWEVTAVDISPTALERAAAAAADAGVAERIDFQRHDLGHGFPDGTFDLVSAQYLHSPVQLPRDAVLRRAAAAVAPGGLLLVVGHAAPPPWASHRHAHASFPTAEGTLAALELDLDVWDAERVGEAERDATGPDGVTGTIRDSVLAIRRRPPA